MPNLNNVVLRRIPVFLPSVDEQSEIVATLDGIDLKDFDFVDIGEELPDAKAVPVVIKSLIFRHEEWGRGRLLASD